MKSIFSRHVNQISTVLVLLGFLTLAITFAPIFIEELNYRLAQAQPQKEILIPDSEDDIKNLTKDPEVVEQKTILIPDNFDFSLVIPKIGINARIFPNINSGDPGEYLPILKKGAAHALNSSLPDQPGPVFIFAHSTDNFYNISRYNAVFFLLRKLKPGEDIYVFYNNKKYHYQVNDQKIVDPDEIPSIVSSIKDDTLVLQTCYPPGTTMNRLLLFAKLK